MSWICRIAPVFVQNREFSGFVLDNGNCKSQRVNECLLGTHSCDANAECLGKKNLYLGSFRIVFRHEKRLQLPMQTGFSRRRFILRRHGRMRAAKRRRWFLRKYSRKIDLFQHFWQFWMPLHFRLYDAKRRMRRYRRMQLEQDLSELFKMRKYSWICILRMFIWISNEWKRLLRRRKRMSKRKISVRRECEMHKYKWKLQMRL